LDKVSEKSDSILQVKKKPYRYQRD
jgi:hypothetical protein